MGVSIFGLTPASVRQHMFPQLSDWSLNSSPTLAIVTECIEEEAGQLAGKLYAENVVASDILSTLDANNLHSAAWLWCVRTLRLMVALEVLKRMSQQYPALAKAYSDELAVRLKDLDERGATVLGNAALGTGTNPANGPTSHVSQYSLAQLGGEDMSDVIPPLQKKDRL